MASKRRKKKAQPKGKESGGNLLAKMQQDKLAQVKTPDDSGLSVVSQVAVQVIAQEKKYMALAEELSAAQEHLRELTERTLPDAMAQVGLTEFTTTTGYKITVEEVVTASIAKKNHEKAMAWLRKHGHGDLIKGTLTVPFGKGEEADIEQISAFTEDHGFGYEKKVNIHHSTLRALAKRQVEAGKPLPKSIFGTYQFSKAKVALA